ncbi:MAG: nicotinate-nucleotide--dimethylbenzimidazole phosphoribosyltransferase [Alphaproteobacteria bacterium]|nr:nicotinate-nucleotide--dimethylbenzimidazole phosphoribosyltransferase [Alphaproteobacteria bacterium]
MSVRLPASMADVLEMLGELPGPGLGALAKANEREPQLTKPPGALGRLEEISAWMCAWQDNHPPRLERPRCVVFAGNHGVAARGVSAFPPEVTAQMVANFQHGGAAINQLCWASGAELTVTALDLERPTADFTKEAAMSECDFIDAFCKGMASVKPGTDLLAIGEMGIANTSAAAAVAHALFGGEAQNWTGPGTGVQGQALDRKAQVVGEAVAFHKPGILNPIDALRRLGGRELAAMAGAVLAARFMRVPVLLDGYVCTAAAAPLHLVHPMALDHCLVAHASAEPAHRALCSKLGKTPLLDLGLRLGEASGAALAIGIVKGAVACHTGMATFAEAMVSGKG